MILQIQVGVFFCSRFEIREIQFNFCSILNNHQVISMGIACFEIIVENCYFDTLLIRKNMIYLNDNLFKVFNQHTNLYYSFILHVFLSVLIMHNLIYFIKNTFVFIEFLKLEKKAFLRLQELSQFS